MKRYKFSYQTVVSYDDVITWHQFLLRCCAREDHFQKVVERQLHMIEGTHIEHSVDAFGNEIVYGSMIEKHDIFVVASSGIVECQKYEIIEEKPSPLFLSATKMTQPNEAMTQFERSITPLGSHLEQALALSAGVNSHISYIPRVTSISTTATECFSLKMGVCQDFAHVLIALCRNRAIFARYVVGLVVGTGETHAWVEVYSEGKWHGVDPTHNRLIDYGYIKIAHGRDASDCSVVRGTHRGTFAHSTQIKVDVKEIVNI